MKDHKAVYQNGIMFFTRYMTGIDFEIGTRVDWREINPMVQKLSVPDLHDMAAQLISAVRASGQVIEIENVGMPQYGMGGYCPTVSLRSSYPKVREAMDELQARKDGTAIPPKTLKTHPGDALQQLKSRLIPWPDADAELQDALESDPRHLPHKTLVRVVQQLDRRLMQMWDKVGFERQHELVDYAPINKELKEINLPHGVTVGELAKRLSVTSQEVIKKLTAFGAHDYTVGRTLTGPLAVNIAGAFGYIATMVNAPKDEDKSKGIDDFTTNCRDWFVSVFESRYDDKVFAFAAFSTELDIKVREFADGDFEFEYLLLDDLTKLDYFPLASGSTFTEAVRNLDKKLKRVPLLSPGKDYTSWLRYVNELNTRIERRERVDVSWYSHFKLSENDAAGV